MGTSSLFENHSNEKYFYSKHYIVHMNRYTRKKAGNKNQNSLFSTCYVAKGIGLHRVIREGEVKKTPEERFASES